MDRRGRWCVTTEARDPYALANDDTCAIGSHWPASALPGFQAEARGFPCDGDLPEGKMHNLYILAVRDEPSSDAERGLNSR